MGSKEPGLRSSVLRIAWPASVEFLIVTGVFLADTIFLGRLGTEVLAGVGVAVTVFRVFHEIFYSVAVASTTVVAQAVGARNMDLARRGAAQSVLLATGLGFVSGGIGFVVASHLMGLMGTGGPVRNHGTIYMQLNLLASPLYAAAVAGGGVLKGVGDTRTPMGFTLVSSAVKIILSWCLAFGRLGFPKLGVVGAGLATIFAHGLNAILISGKLAAGFDGIKLGWHAFRPDWVLLRRVFMLALPVAGERIVMRIGFMFYVRVVAALGTAALAANNIAVRLESIFLTFGFGFTIAATTLVGQAVGRRDFDSAAGRVRATMEFSLVVMTSVTVILLLVREWAVGMFSPEAGVEQLALVCLAIGAFELPALGFLFTYGGALRGAGDTRSPMVVALVGTFGFRLPLVYLLGIQFDLGLRGIWYGTLLDWIGRSILIYLIFRTGRWKQTAFVEEEEIEEK